MDIVKHIKQHTEKLQNRLVETSPEQRQNLKVIALGFYALLPDFEEAISKYIKMDVNEKQLISDIKNGNVDNYRKAFEKSYAETDPYLDDFEELEQIEIFILDAFENLVSETNNTESLVGLFIGIIDTLDYYENFSENPEYWNDLLEKEITFQNEILATLKTKVTIDTSIYQKRYENVEFGEF